MPEQLLGFIGLGNMGGPMAVNLAAGGNSLICFDTAGTTERAPQGAKHASSVDEIAQQAEIIFFCLPDGPTVEKVARDVIATDKRVVKVIVYNTTSGASEARATHDLLANAGPSERKPSGVQRRAVSPPFL